MRRFRDKYSNNIDLNNDMFKTLCTFQAATGDEKALELIENIIYPKEEVSIPAPPTLKPPKTIITTTTTTTTTIINPPANLTINIDNIRGTTTDMGSCIKSLNTNKRFLELRNICDNAKSEPFTGLYIEGDIELAKD